MVNSNRIGPFVALVLSAPFGWMACNSILGIEEPELRVDTGRPIDVDDAGGEGGCDRLTWPTGPAKDDESTSKAQTFTVAVRSVALSLTEPGMVNAGYDLDKRCTCLPDAPNCTAPPLYKEANCDESRGRDVSLNRTIVPSLLTNPGFTPKDISDGFERGAYGIVVRLENYNGQANDTKVTASLYLSPGVTPTAAPPKWTGDDPWDIDPTSTAPGPDGGPPRSIYLDENAFVRDGVLVAANFSTLRLPLPIGTGVLNLELGSPIVTANLVKDATTGRFALKTGTVAGRIPVKSLFRAIGPLPVPSGFGDGMTICQAAQGTVSAGAYKNFVKGYICRAADILSSVNRDNDPGLECDAISFVMRFETDVAKLGVPRTKPTFDGGCGAWEDDCTK